MKSTWAIVLALAVVLSGTVMAADCSSAAEFPSVDRIIETIQPPDYSVDRFIEDAKYIFSDKMIGEMMNYGSNLIDFVAKDTFVADIANGNVTAETFTTNYINLFVLLCVVIAVICVLGAFLSYLGNRRTFIKKRDV